MASLKSLDNLESFSPDLLGMPIEELIELIKLERKKYNEYTIIKDAALTCTENSSLSPEVSTKIQDLFMSTELDHASNGALLGLPPVSIPEFTYQEKILIKNAIQTDITKNCSKLLEELDELDIGYNAKKFKEEDEELFNLKKELNTQQQMYVSKLEELIFVFEEIIKLKSETLPDVANKEINLSEIKLKLYNLQSELLNAQLKVNVFTETECSMLAYDTLVKDIVQQQTECKEEIRKLEELKEQYKEVSCEQFNEILQKYIKYKAKIDQNKCLREKVEENNA